MNFQEESKKRGTTGYRLIVDGEQIAYARWSKKLERELSGIVSNTPPAVYRNALGELAIDYDRA